MIRQKSEYYYVYFFVPQKEHCLQSGKLDKGKAPGELCPPRIMENHCWTMDNRLRTKNSNPYLQGTSSGIVE